jgi:hypothetical protein
MNVFAHDMGIDFSSFYISVSEKFLQNTDVNTMLKHMSGKGMAKGMDGGSFINTGF